MTTITTFHQYKLLIAFNLIYLSSLLYLYTSKCSSTSLLQSFPESPWFLFLLLSKSNFLLYIVKVCPSFDYIQIERTFIRQKLEWIMSEFSDKREENGKKKALFFVKTIDCCKLVIISIWNTKLFRCFKSIFMGARME